MSTAVRPAARDDREFGAPIVASPGWRLRCRATGRAAVFYRPPQDAWIDAKRQSRPLNNGTTVGFAKDAAAVRRRVATM